VAAEAPARRRLPRAARRFLAHRGAVAGVVVLAVVLVVAMWAPLFAPHDPLQIGLARPRSGPTVANPLGVDALGRDLASRLVYGARASLIVGFGAVAVQVAIGLLVGAVAGFVGGALDTLLMRFADVLLSFPLFVVVVAAVAITGPGLRNLILVVGLLGWPRIARLVRAQVLSLRTYPYVEATQALGGRGARVLVRHILPNVLPTIVIAATFGIARAILLEASLSFLGMGVQAPQPSWGNILTAAQSLSVLESMPWMWVPAGAAIMLAVLAVNFIGDGLRDALDPRVRA
jgi:peptide/nickel transport system permease protein